jgi:hypothetical protein
VDIHDDRVKSKTFAKKIARFRARLTEAQSN